MPAPYDPLDGPSPEGTSLAMKQIEWSFTKNDTMKDAVQTFSERLTNCLNAIESRMKYLRGKYHTVRGHQEELNRDQAATHYQSAARNLSRAYDDLNSARTHIYGKILELDALLVKVLTKFKREEGGSKRIE